MMGAFPSAFPSVIVNPAIVTVGLGLMPLGLMSKTRLASLPLIVSLLAPGPSMSRFWVVQLAGGQRDAVDILGEDDRVGGGGGDRLAERVGAAVGAGGDERAEHRAVFQPFQPGHGGTPPGGLTPRSEAVVLVTPGSRCEGHDVRLR